MTVCAPAEPALSLRRERILAMLKRDRVVEVAMLAKTFGVSAVTVRNDLDHLERRSLLRRIRGGAMASQPARFERPVDLPSQSFAEEKRRIGVMAARMVRDGETIILDAGATTLAMAMALDPALRDVVVVTSSLDIALALHRHQGATVIVTGGTLKKAGRNPQSHSLISPFGALMLEQINADCAFLGCAGIDAERGFTNANFEEIAIKRAMLASARRTVMLGDHGKIGHVAGARIAIPGEVAVLVTDSGAAPADIQALATAGLDVVLA